MKLKLIAAAALLAATGAANAAIENGSLGNGELFFTAWDGANSYNFDFNTTIDAFQSAVAAPTAYSQTFSLDALFGTFLSTASLSNLVWNIAANDIVGARRVISTYTELPAARITNDLGRSMAGGIASFVTAVNGGIAAQGGVNSAVFAVGTPGYADNQSGIRFGDTFADGANFSNTGTVANNSYASGLNLMRFDIAPSGVNAATYTPYAEGGFALRAYLDTSARTVTISAVPEPETYAMLLAGLGLMGAIARRRRQS